MNQPPEDWRQLELSGIRERLIEVRNLLRQAAAVGLAQDVSCLETLADLHKQGKPDGHKNRRRYR
jgi:hypothetical protein